MAWLEWVIGNPNATWQDRGAGLDALISEMKKQCTAKGCPILYAATSHERLSERYRQHGFIETDKGMTHFIYAER